MIKPIAIFQQKKNGLFTGEKMYYYLCTDKQFYYVSIGTPFRGNHAPKPTSQAGLWVSALAHNNLTKLTKHLKSQNFHRYK